MAGGSLKLYTNPNSRGRIARWMLEEVGATYETIVVAYGPEMRAADYLALNPMGKVPTLVHDDAIVTECGAICTYLADIFPEAGLAPRPEERAAYNRWLFFGAGPLDAALTNNALGFQPANARQEGMTGYGSLERVVTTLEAALTKQPYLTGERFTAADVYLGAQVGFGLSFRTLPVRPAFEAYYERVKTRPAFRKAEEIDEELAASASD